MRCVALILLLFALVSPAVAQEDVSDDLFEDYIEAGDENLVSDPLYWFNYGMYSFNDKLYFWVLKPVSKGYGRLVPGELRTGIDNMFYNLIFPVRFVNSVFQGKIRGAGSELGSFAVNSVVGFLGFARPAQDVLGMETSREDLGQTLGSYSIKEGFYIVLPFLGPSTLRDLVGTVGDGFLSPINYVTPQSASYGLMGFNVVNKTSLMKVGDYETLKQAAVDPYLAIKNGYIQLRRKRIQE